MSCGEREKAAEMHTPEPWIFALPDDDHEGFICGRHGGTVVDGEFTEANARRIVACVNACAGIPTEHLERRDVITALDEILKQRKALKQQRDELLALLERYRNETPVGHQPHMICHVVDDAIARIKGAE